MTAKERVREILQNGVIKSHLYRVKSGASLWQAEVKIQLTDQALANIEKAFDEVIGKTEYTGGDNYIEAQNDLRTEQRKRWSGE